MIVLSILFWLAVALSVLALGAFLLGRFYTVDREPAAIVYCRTEDGWRVALQHHPPREPIPGAPPVLLVPGFACGSAVFDFDPDASLAPYLASFGHDLWLLDWRGHAPSEHPRLFGRRRSSWSFDDYVEFDLPAALEAVCRETGSSEVQLVGLGAGGLALLAGASGLAARRVRSLALLGAPAFFRRASAALPRWPLRLLHRLPLVGLVRLLAPLLGRIYPGPLALLCNRDNLEPASFRRALVNAVRAPAARECDQLAEWLRDDRFQAEGAARDYRALLEAVQAPTLLLHGPRDPFAPADAIEATSAALRASPERVTVLASRIGGMSANYGHLDLLLGRNARRDVFPHLLKWLDLQAGVLIEEEGRPEPPQAEQPEAWRRAARKTSEARTAEAAPTATALTPASDGPAPAPAPAGRPAPATLAPEVPAPADPGPAPGPAEPSEPADAPPVDPIRSLEEEAREEDDEPSWLLGDVPRVPGPPRNRDR